MDTFDSLIVPSTSLEYATKMTISDRADFDSLSLQTPEARGTQLRCLVQRSNSFIIAIAECGKAYPNLNYRLNDLAQVRRAHSSLNDSANSVPRDFVSAVIGTVWLPWYMANSELSWTLFT